MGVRRRVRSAITGRFVGRAAGGRWPKSTVSETVKADQAPALRWRCTDLEAVMLEVAADLKRPRGSLLGLAARLEASARDVIPEERIP